MSSFGGYSMGGSRESKCETHGVYTEKSTKLLSTERWHGCSACHKERREKEERKAESEAVRERQLKISSKFEDAKIPAKFLDANFSHFTCFKEQEKQEKALEIAMSYSTKLIENSENPSIYLINGGTGTGKTLLASALANSVKTKKTVLFANHGYLIDSIKDKYNRGSSHTEMQMLHAAFNVDLLIVDELGAESSSATDAELFFKIINHRHSNYRPVVMMSNLDDEPMFEVLGQRITDRIRENGYWRKFTWSSYRGEPAS